MVAQMVSRTIVVNENGNRNVPYGNQNGNVGTRTGTGSVTTSIRTGVWPSLENGNRLCAPTLGGLGIV